MKIGGIEIKGPNEAILVLPRSGQNIVFRAQAILDFSEFNSLCPEPQPPVKTTPKGTVADIQNPGFVVARVEYDRRKTAWMVIKSLTPSNIEWDTVDPQSPGTWINYHTDLEEAGFCSTEIARIVDLVAEANCLDEEKLKWAREAFLQGTQE